MDITIVPQRTQLTVRQALALLVTLPVDYDALTHATGLHAKIEPEHLSVREQNFCSDSLSDLEVNAQDEFGYGEESPDFRNGRVHRIFERAWNGCTSPVQPEDVPDEL